jgi:hypothetical protein
VEHITVDACDNTEPHDEHTRANGATCLGVWLDDDEEDLDV